MDLEERGSELAHKITGTAVVMVDECSPVTHGLRSVTRLQARELSGGVECRWNEKIHLAFGLIRVTADLPEEKSQNRPRWKSVWARTG